MKGPAKGVIAAGHEATARAGASILRRGGNAVDAVVAAAFTSFMSELTLTSAGGGGFINLYLRERHEARLYDFFVNMPGLGNPHRPTEKDFFPVNVNFGTTHQEFHVGPASVAVPGSIAGLFEAHRSYGTLPMEDVLQPAIQLSRQGLVVNRHQAYFIALLEPILTLTDTGKSYFAPRGKLLQEGDLLLLPDFADTLEALSREGPALFYEGALADRLLTACPDDGFLLTGEDLRSYRVKVRSPLVFDYRDYTIVTNPPPSTGGALIALCLKILEEVDLPSASSRSADVLNALIGAMQITNAIRELSENLPEERSEEFPVFLRPKRIAEYRLQLYRLLKGEMPRPEGPDLSGGSSSTTHISVLDKFGNAASMTASNGEGSGIFIPGTGIMLNNMLGEEDLNPGGFHQHTPGRRVSSMMAPTIILKGEEPVAVLGSGGSNRIRSAIVQSILNLIDFKMEIQEVVDAPRIHWEQGVLNQEPGIEAQIAPHLCDPVKRILWKETNLYFGGVHAVTRITDSGEPAGAGDHRRGGVSITV